MTVGELIERLSKFDPSLPVELFCEDSDYGEYFDPDLDVKLGMAKDKIEYKAVLLFQSCLLRRVKEG